MQEELTQAQRDELEGLIDRSSLSVVVGTLAEICYAKAEHLRSNWQDIQAFKDWCQMAQELGTTADRAEGL